jgi:hypothetical protein
MAMLLAAMGSLVTISSRSIPDRVTGPGQVTSAAAALEQVASDLSLATTVVSASEKAIEILVPDRDADGNQESIAYTWSGRDLDPLVRIVNNGERGVVASSVSQFALSYVTASTIAGAPSLAVAQAEVVLASWAEGLAGGVVFTGYPLEASSPLAQNFSPSLPASTRSWTVNRVQFYCTSDLFPTGTIDVQLRTTDSAGLSENSLSAFMYGMKEVTFSDPPVLAPDQEVAIVLVCTSGCPSGTIGYTTRLIRRSTPMSIWASGGWQASSFNVMPHVVYGTVTTTSLQEVSVKRLHQIGVQLQVGSSSSGVQRTTVNILNTPGVN